MNIGNRIDKVVYFDPEVFTIADMHRFRDGTDSIEWYNQADVDYNEIEFISLTEKQSKQLNDYIAKEDKLHARH